MKQAIKNTDFNFEGQTGNYKGKVRDVYYIGGKKMVMVVSDRISAFDCVLPKAIPFKGEILNKIAIKNLEATTDILPNWMETSPDPNVIIGKKCETFKVEMVIRGYLTGHAWRTYKSGLRTLCGVDLPEGLKEHDKFETPLLTPTTKADVGHDEDISRAEILKQGLVSEKDYLKLEEYTRALFQRGTELAAKRGLILVDTKYEFGKFGDTIYLIDEIHTPDSSRFFYLDGYEEGQKSGKGQKQLSKEFVREWLMEQGFQGKDGQQMPEMTDEFINSVTERYAELYELIIGEKLNLEQGDVDLEDRIFKNVSNNL